MYGGVQLEAFCPLHLSSSTHDSKMHLHAGSQGALSDIKNEDEAGRIVLSIVCWNLLDLSPKL